MNTRAVILILALLTVLGLVGAFFLLESPEDTPDPVPVGAPTAREEGGAPSPIPPLEAAGEVLPKARSGAEPTRLEQPSGGAAIIEGRIVSRAGNAPPGAVARVVRIEKDGFLERYLPTDVSEIADPQGRFRLVGVPSDTPLGVEAVHPDYASRLVAPFRIESGQTRDLGDIVLETGTTMRGLVTDTEDVPVAGATITVSDFSRVPDDPAAIVDTAETDADGLYLIEHLSQRQYTVDVAREGFAPVKTVLSFVLGTPAAGWEQDFIIERALLPLRGFVLDNFDQAVPGVLLKIVRRPHGGTAYFTDARRTDEEGAFSFDALPEGRFDMLIESPAYYLAVARKIESGREDHRVYVKPAVAVVGQLVADPMPGGFTVTARPDARTGASLLQGVERSRRFKGADPPGSFRFTGLKPGTYAFEVAAPGYALTRSHDVIMGPDVPEVELVVPLTRGGTIRGSLSEAIADARIELRAADWDPVLPLEQAFPTPPLPGQITSTADDGSFVMEHVPAGTYVLTARPPGSPAVHRRDQPVVEGGESDAGVLVVLKGATVEGTLSGPDGRPRSGSKIVITSTDHNQQTTSRIDGTWRFDAVPPGRYAVNATPAGLAEALRFEATSELVITEADTASADPVTLELQLVQRVLQGSNPFEDR